MKNWRYVPAIMVTMLIIGLTLMMLSISIPNDNIKRNLLRSGLIKREGASAYLTPLGSSLGGIEYVMLPFGLQSDQRGFGNRFASIIKAPTTCTDRDHFKKILADEPVQPFYYTRYWHGYSVLYRLLLIRFAYQGVNSIMRLGLQVLFVAAILAFIRRGGTAAAFGLITPLLFLPLQAVVTLNFAQLYAVTLLAVFIVAVSFRKRDSTLKFVNIFLVIGGMTSFVDMLTNPIVTFIVPAIALMWLKGLESTSSHKDDLQFLFNIAAAWCVGYFGFWSFKFGLVFLQEGIAGIQGIIGACLFRLHAPVIENSSAISFGSAAFRNIFFRVGGNMTIFGTAVALAILLHPARANLLNAIRKRAAMLAICPIPILWYEVFANHTYVHSSFTSWNSYLIILPLAVIVAGSYCDSDSSTH